MNKKKAGLNEYTDIEIKDLDTIRKYLKKYNFRTCDYNAANLFTWSRYMNVKWGVYKNRLMFYNFNWHFMLYPLGDPFSPEELNELSGIIMEEGYEGNFISVPEEYIKKNPDLEKYFDVVLDEPNSDYLYLTERLASLSGKKLNKKKNLVSQFIRNYPEYSVEKCSKSHKEMCLDLAEKWCRVQTVADEDDKELEMKVLKRALDNFEELGLEGLLLFHKEKLAAFTYFSEQGNDSVTVHFEKFDYDFKGSAQMINRETALYLKDRYKYINREQDVGKEGLRQAKMSYDPVELIRTYRLIRKVK